MGKLHFHEIRPHFEDVYGEFLYYAVVRSRCDRFPREQLRYSAGW